ncbi:hypothetical protein GFS31_39010 [Leptolyngbya sp. BL0902]|uniref:hypothetical protein n=1 Tax=Leptolyngbya sp. BL0902 TaxID=1115757 RepID=UPI0018E8FF33|nr:hypothetical protein [Leptolyngbya sp. BL0902]QQE67189.1 hypothetical protein GFS31_39010 [Leptolyngbya sp. BL0902]
MLTSVHQPARQVAQGASPQRVAIAGTVINAATQEGLPQVMVRITHAPAACVQGFLKVLEDSLADHPHLIASYRRLTCDRPITPDTLKLAQLLFNTFERHQWLVAPRPDQTLTGGDGHYCFFDLPPGDYGLTATLTIPKVCQGSTHGRVRVDLSDQRLSFSALDLSLTLEPATRTAPGFASLDLLPWPRADALYQAQAALQRS